MILKYPLNKCWIIPLRRFALRTSSDISIDLMGTNNIWITRNLRKGDMCLLRPHFLSGYILNVLLECFPKSTTLLKIAVFSIQKFLPVPTILNRVKV